MKQYAWQEWDDYTIYEEEEEEDLHEGTGIWVDCPYEECVIDDDDEWDDATEVEIFSWYVDYAEVDDHEIRELESDYTDVADDELAEDINTSELPQTGYNAGSFIIISVALILVGVGIVVLKVRHTNKK